LNFFASLMILLRPDDLMNFVPKATWHHIGVPGLFDLLTVTAPTAAAITNKVVPGSRHELAEGPLADELWHRPDVTPLIVHDDAALSSTGSP
jgi:hypothetical protein